LRASGCNRCARARAELEAPPQLVSLEQIQV